MFPLTLAFPHRHRHGMSWHFLIRICGRRMINFYAMWCFLQPSHFVEILSFRILDPVAYALFSVKMGLLRFHAFWLYNIWQLIFEGHICSLEIARFDALAGTIHSFASCKNDGNEIGRSRAPVVLRRWCWGFCPHGVRDLGYGMSWFVGYLGSLKL